jgi:two-component system phosphate regulon sensor histidine kinase PhoR
VADLIFSPLATYFLIAAVVLLIAALFWALRRSPQAEPVQAPQFNPSPIISSSEVLLEVTKNLRESIIIVDQNMIVTASNRLAQQFIPRLNGHSSDNPEPRRLSEAIRDLSVHAAFEKALTAGDFSEVKLDNFGSEKRAFDLRVAPLVIGNQRQAIGIFYDITELEMLETVRQEFLSNVSHELRTPLTSIIAYVETLEDGALEDALNNRRFLQIIRKNASRMHRLIDDILELSSIEAGKISVDPREVQLTSMVKETVSALNSKAEDKKVIVKNEIAPGVRVWADGFRLEQMLTNLIDNAIKFNREGGSVTISHKQENGKDLISIADTGEGIAEDQMPRLFERFYRTDKARSRDLGGTGLGLAIVKHLARLHGGEVTVCSGPDKGSIFTIELPAKQ